MSKKSKFKNKLSNKRTDNFLVNSPRDLKKLNDKILYSVEANRKANRFTPFRDLPRQADFINTDNRFFKPELQNTFETTLHGKVILSSFKDLNSRIASVSPFKTTYCVRRKKRRQVLFALGRIGAGRKSAAKKKKLWVASSYISCK